jgi:opacity protein-like surface antigen
MHTRTLLAVALAALVAAPSAAGAQTRRSTRAQADRSAAPSTAPADGLSVGGLVGWEWGDEIDGFQLRADGEMPFQQLTPQLKLSLVGSVGYTRSTYGYFGNDLTVNRLKLVPTARVTFPINPQLSVYGDAGIGLHYTWWSWDFGPVGSRASDSGIGLMLRFGAGGAFQLNPRLRVLGELVFDPTFGEYNENSIALLVGLMYQL